MMHKYLVTPSFFRPHSDSCQQKASFCPPRWKWYDSPGWLAMCWAMGNYRQRTEVKFGESWEVPSEGTFHHSQIGLQNVSSVEDVTTYPVFCGGQRWLTMKTFVHAIANKSWLTLNVSWLSLACLAQASLLMRISLAVFTMFLSIHSHTRVDLLLLIVLLSSKLIPLPHCLFICGQIVGLWVRLTFQKLLKLHSVNFQLESGCIGWWCCPGK